jgi:TRAP-type C4-dicarboxylate transport system permease small subunit
MMIQGQPARLKKICLWSLVIVCGIVAACFSFIFIVSVWTGLANTHQSGFWVPIFVGASLLTVVFCVFFRVIKRILKQMKEENVVNI